MNKQGILHKLMLFVILIAGFGLALTLPAWKRYQDQSHAQQAVVILQQLAQQEQAFYAKQGVYTADLASWADSLPCMPMEKDGESMLRCDGYEVSLEQAQVLSARSIKYPQWFHMDIEGTKIHCEYENTSPVGEKLCASVQL